jgi:hypothetical protein
MTTQSEAQGSAQKRTLSATEAMVGWFRKREKERRESKFLVVRSEAQRCSFFLLVWKKRFPSPARGIGRLSSSFFGAPSLFGGATD